MDLDTGDGSLEGSRAQIKQARCACSYQYNSPRQVLRRHVPREDLPSRNKGCRAVGTKFQDHPATGVGWDLQITDLEVIESGITAESRFTAGVCGFQNVGACALCNAQ